LTSISREKAERIARSHACERCQEYSYKRVAIRPADAEHRAELQEEWHATLICGVCGLHQEIGIDEEGDIVYVA
jgi:transcription elongation factor Elf1